MLKVFLWFFGLLRYRKQSGCRLCAKQRQQRKAEQIRCRATGIQGHAQTTKNIDEKPMKGILITKRRIYVGDLFVLNFISGRLQPAPPLKFGGSRGS
ncbi:hypothetical protein Forpe1208_v008747 [Fusarium oxysporum f. sp. rapae]|uniref:Secreted protein n=1 Tax=Fusarium oxysporum f. sp. rapae TaxID=485398 RepID=A0A8J5NUE4_FUSOX|nr:hypothetical protein Forpe1208_v008747 [Fusarium oxysporum f. sp. rapae]